jgi:hypothetical protein
MNRYQGLFAADSQSYHQSIWVRKVHQSTYGTIIPKDNFSAKDDFSLLKVLEILIYFKASFRGVY